MSPGVCSVISLCVHRKRAQERIRGAGDGAQWGEVLAQHDEALGLINCCAHMLAHTCHPDTWKMEAGSAKVQDHPRMYITFEVNSGYMRPCLGWRGGELLGGDLFSLAFCFLCPCS